MSGENTSETKPMITAAEVEEKLLRGPFHQWLGLKVVSVGDGEIELTATWRPEWVVNAERGYVHGGILATLIDLTADWALVSKTGRGVPTVDLRVDYHRAAMQGDLTAKGKVVKFGGTLSVAEAQVLDSEGRLLASGRGVYMTATPK
ncbi:PaaI family thioesterase [Methylopila sp. Yamaguchi]|uniref:PaaI family thioesterase n=1 Tax=Methylopila sp. Yamaguchi TaxID=1437817 RepID=UPI000CC8BDFD|nr:PaaI family thioesterase [Methylopila sp. Yamaguchi]GBD50442.1 thioesterase superfamily protein [Methylopila sp. Yamaguchi]